MAQKARREVEAKTREKAERQRIVEEEKRKIMLEYLQQLRDEMLEEEVALLEGTKEFKHKEVTARNEEGQQPSKKAKEK